MTLKDGIGLRLSGDALTAHIIDAFKILFTATSSQTRSKASLGEKHSQNRPYLEHY